MSSLSEGLTVILTTSLVLTKVEERLAESKQAAQKIDMDRFNLKKLNEREIKDH
jgi:hypothetical protein